MRTLWPCRLFLQVEAAKTPDLIIRHPPRCLQEEKSSKAGCICLYDGQVTAAGGGHAPGSGAVGADERQAPAWDCMAGACGRSCAGRYSVL